MVTIDLRLDVSACPIYLRCKSVPSVDTSTMSPTDVVSVRVFMLLGGLAIPFLTQTYELSSAAVDDWPSVAGTNEPRLDLSESTSSTIVKM